MIVEVEQVERQGLALVGEAQRVVIRDAAEYHAAGNMLQKIKAYLKRVAKICDPEAAAALTTHWAALAQKQKLEAPAKDAEGLLKRAMLMFQQQLERERQAAQQQAETAAEEARLAAALAAEAAGDAEGITEALTAPVLPPKEPRIPKAAGISLRETWKAEVVNLRALVQSVAEGQAPLETLQSNQLVLNALARSLKDALNLPGVNAVREQGLAART